MYSVYYYNNVENKYTTIFKYDVNYLNELNAKTNSIYKTILLDFLIPKYIYDYKDKKKIMQCLRHFDEVGVSNELWEAMDSIPINYSFFTLLEENSDNIKIKNLIFKNILEEI